jgi:hypothetical protein
MRFPWTLLKHKSGFPRSIQHHKKIIKNHIKPYIKPCIPHSFEGFSPVFVPLPTEAPCCWQVGPSPTAPELGCNESATAMLMKVMKHGVIQRTNRKGYKNPIRKSYFMGRFYGDIIYIIYNI